MTENSILISLRGGHVYTVTDLELQMWTQAYPRVDVRSEVLAMAAWCTANPSKRKTERGIHRFINGWLGKAKERKPAQKKINYAAAHKPFSSNEKLCKTSDTDKLKGDEQLAKMWALIKARK